MCTDPTPQAPDAPGTRGLTAGPLELTTPPRGPVFPGEPWKKKLGHSEMSSPGKGGPLAPCSSWSNPTPRPTAAQTWPLSLSSLPWYLISFDAWQALGSWNSWGALLSFGALRWGKKTKQCSKLKNPVVSPLAPQQAYPHLSSLRAWLPYWSPFTLVTLKCKKEVGPGLSAGPAF